ncbi:MAG: flavodoxin family protein [Geobacteraceae bacterium]|nr:flavodoxin family protein [Geobacteraceae bacterium]
MKVVIIESSPRQNGNSTILAQEVASGARSLGAEVDIVHLHGMDIRPCFACDACQESLEKDCIIDDDMRALYPRLRSADAIVYATPIYWFTVSGQIKLLMDRCYSLTYMGAVPGEDGEPVYTVETDLGGKKFGVVLTYGDVDPFVSGAVNAMRTFQDMARYVGSEIVGIVYGSAVAPGEVAENESLMKQAYDLGRQIAAGV